MTDPYGSKVREFHEAFGLKVRDTPEVGAPEERVLRVRLMLEEVLEFAKAAGVSVTLRTSLADVAYVTHGTAVQLGIPLLPVVAEVHAANMRKLGPDGKPIVDERGKVRKPPDWKPADVGAVLKRLNEGEE